MNKLLIFGAMLLLFIGCDENKPKEAEKNAVAVEISSVKWPKKAAINPIAMDTLRNWPEFNAMDISFDALYTVKNPEDLKLVVEELIEKQKLLEASKYPAMFDKAQVKGRQKVFKTFFLKIKGNLEYQLDTEEPILETINAYNALRNQFNVIVNSSLDSNLILEEK